MDSVITAEFLFICAKIYWAQNSLRILENVFFAVNNRKPIWNAAELVNLYLNGMNIKLFEIFCCTIYQLL